MYRYECEGVGFEDLLYRRWLNPNYKNIKFRDLIIKMMDLTRKKVPILSDDYSLIVDEDYYFTVFKDRNKYIGELFEEIRSIGFEIYLRPDLKLVARMKTTGTKTHVDFYNSKINTETCVLSNSTIGQTYKPAPITSLVVKGGYSTQGTLTSLNLFSNTQPTYDLNSDISFEDQFIFQPFETNNPQGYTKNDITGIGWDKRNLIFDTPIIPEYGIHSEIKFQLLSNSGDMLLSCYTDGNNIAPSNIFAGFRITNGALKVIANLREYDTGITLYPYLQKSVIAISADGFTITLDSTDGLQVGDLVNIAGLSSSINATNAEILTILGNNITININCTDGTLVDVYLTRVEEYTLRWVLTTNQGINFYLKRANNEFQLISNQLVSGLMDNGFFLVYNDYSGQISNTENGIMEVGITALDYWFLDKNNLIKLWNANNEKVYLSTADQFNSLVDIEAVVNRITKNEISFGQIEFISPSIVRTVFNNSGTLTRIPLVFSTDDFLKIGMRVLYKDKAYNITNFYKDLTSGYIEVFPQLDSIPLLDEIVYINTSIPSSESSFRVEYIPAEKIVIRECACDLCMDRFGFRESAIELPEINSISEIAVKSLALIRDECNPKISGNFGFIMGSDVACHDTRLKSWFDIPQVGSYIKVSDSDQGISYELAQVQAITINQADDDKYNIAIDFGVETLELTETTSKLLKKFGFYRGENNDDITLQVPCLMRDSIYYEDTEIQLYENLGFDFLSGIYYSAYSGMRTLDTEKPVYFKYPRFEISPFEYSIFAE